MSKTKIKSYFEACSKLRSELSKNIDDAVKEDDFYQLKMSEICEIVKSSKIEKIETLQTLVSKAAEIKKEESYALLDVIDPDEFSKEQLIRVICQFNNSPFLQKLFEHLKEEDRLPEVDYKAMYELKKKECDELKNELSVLKGSGVFCPIEKPPNFEPNIIKAAGNGMLTSIRYIVANDASSVNLRDNNGWTPLIMAARLGYLDIVSYLVKKCHANVNDKSKNGFTPLHAAAMCGILSVVKFLVTECGADVSAETSNGKTPLQLAKKFCNKEVEDYLKSL